MKISSDKEISVEFHSPEMNSEGWLEYYSLSDRLKDIVFKVDRNLKATEVKEFGKYFENFGNIIELERYLERGDEVVLVSRVLERETSDYTDFLERIDVEFRLNDSQIKKLILEFALTSCRTLAHTSYASFCVCRCALFT